jgi:hypothetical protein
MSELADAEVRRLIKFLRREIEDIEKLSFIENELRSEFGEEYLRESDIYSYFSNKTVEFIISEDIWKLKIISYTQMRMTKRGIKEKEIVELFDKFLRKYAEKEQIISTGAYSIFGRTAESKSPLTLRMDVDDCAENENNAHTVTVFVGRGNTFETVEVNLIS